MLGCDRSIGSRTIENLATPQLEHQQDPDVSPAPSSRSETVSNGRHRGRIEQTSCPHRPVGQGIVEDIA